MYVLARRDCSHGSVRQPGQAARGQGRRPLEGGQLGSATSTGPGHDEPADRRCPRPDRVPRRSPGCEPKVRFLQPALVRAASPAPVAGTARARPSSRRRAPARELRRLPEWLEPNDVGPSSPTWTPTGTGRGAGHGPRWPASGQGALAAPGRRGPGTAPPAALLSCDRRLPVCRRLLRVLVGMWAIERFSWAPAWALVMLRLAARTCLVVTMGLAAHCSFEFGLVHLRSALDATLSGLVVELVSSAPAGAAVGAQSASAA